jgi:hypothetical protein
MQKGYKPDGWLGLVLGSRIFIDINKYKCVKLCFEQILHQLNAVTTSSSSNINENPIVSKISIKTEKPKACAWTSKEILNWMREKKLAKYLISKHEKEESTGEFLFHLLNDYNNIPQFFYEKILSESNQNLNYYDLVKFTMELKKLFEL